MYRDELVEALLAARPGPGDTVYVDRRESSYGWRLIPAGAAAVGFGDATEVAPDVWIYYSGSWPADDPARVQAVVDDLLAEMESMAGGAERCRWPLDHPWPHTH